MRRGLAFLALASVVVGLELSAETVSLTLARLHAGISAVLSGVEFHVSALRFLLGLVLVALGLSMSVLLTLSVRQRRSVVAVGPACPRCGNRTRRVKRSGMQRLLAALLGEGMTRRKCDTCGWVGLSLRS
ncbi:MAG: hypothetical protein PVJ02_05125 [Gemmatimonadota bacterium]|jgi:hypothetical protein